ncbi:(deoxy)nucleoside triphosphate pyrophosphohydrolase [Sphingomonas sp. 1P08PE]|uniref:(deoxy)nucleoside triphosphate pyrophosphohydrolase n=1 Tax=Sphingomonas sp. 1P08PE TaxID=554122 RepID=UPI0039A02A71
MIDVPEVAAAIIIHDRRVLVTRRAPGQKMAGLWEFPGGKVEPGETVEACIVRELAEELGIATVAGRILMRNLHHYPGGAIELVAVLVGIDAGTIALSVHDAVHWATAADLARLDLAPADIPVARLLHDRLDPGD